MYLLEDSVGIYSKIVNGVTGDRVAILRHGYPSLVLHESGHKFHCEVKKLTYKKIDKIQKVKDEKPKTKKRV
jgi:hypothetical protein